MKKLTLLSLLIAFLAPPIVGSAQNATDIVRKADEKSRGKTAQSTITIQIVRPKWTREMTMKSWSKGKDLSLVLVTSPAKDKGTVFLKRKREAWNWVPSIERTIKLPPSMMSQSWMGTDFTNDDLVKESSTVDDYTHKILGDSTIQGRKCYKILLTPKPNAPVVWGKLIMWIDNKDFLTLKINYFDEDGGLVNTMLFSDIKNMGGRLLPAKMEMIPADKPGNKTVMITNSMVFDKEINDDFFSTGNMKTVK
jgi:outer membrane lipoprotein-sorting protein